ncbi:MAG: sugar phosphate nucleotidyltransferase [Anaerolineae bacterium]
MKAVVMAGGPGSRLRPLTIARPKALVPVVNKPVLAHTLNLLKLHHITEVIITVYHLADQIQDYFGDGGDLGMLIRYSVEESPLGTAGSVKQVQNLLDDTFLVISGDVLTDVDLSALLEFHRSKEALVTLTLKRVADPLDYGLVIADSDGRITQFTEKPGWGQVISDTINAGIYVLEPEVLDRLRPHQSYDFSQDVLPTLLDEGAPLYGYIEEDSYWCDIGTVPAYVRAFSDVLEGRVRHVQLGRDLGNGIWVEPGVEIAPDAMIYGPVYLGQDVKVKEGAVIYGPTMVRDFTVVDSRAQIERASIWSHCYIGESAEVRGAIVCSQCNVRAKSIILEGAVIGDNTLVGRGTVVHPNVKIWPGKEIEAGITVRNSIIWGSQGRRVLFGQYGVTGVVNVDLTPEFTARLGTAFGSILPKGSLVTINRDPHRSPRMLKRALISGLPSAGINVWDLGTQPVPVARYYTCQSVAVAGIHVRLSPYDERMVDIRFFDHTGANLDETSKRRVEQSFFREDFRRVYLDEIGTIAYAPAVVETYLRNFLQAVNRDAIRHARFYIVVDYANSPVASVLPTILNEVGCNVIALNANIDESRLAIQPYEFQSDLERLGVITGTLKARLGIRFDVSGERIFLVDDMGKLIPDSLAALAFADLALRLHPGGVIAVPVKMPDEFELVAARYGGRVMRTPMDARALSNVAGNDDIVMAATGNGGFIFPAFQATSDGMMAAVRLLEYLALSDTTLSAVVAELPPFYTLHQAISCPWETKGIVMRRISQYFQNEEIDNTDGIKIRFGKSDWVLLLSDPDYPLFQVYAQAPSQPLVSERMASFVNLVLELQK